MDRRDDVAPGSTPKRAETPERSRAIGAEPEARVGHHVADDLDAPGDALGDASVSARALVRAEQERREPVDLDPVALLRHREVAAAQPRLDVRDRHAGAPAASAPASVEFVSP